MYLIASVCALAFVFNGCGSAVSIDDGGLSSGTSPHDEDQVIIQTRQDGDHLEVFTLGQAFVPGVSPHIFTQEERDRDYLAGRSGGTLGRNVNGTIYRYPVDWDMSTDLGFNDGTRVSLDGGDGAYITDHAVEATRRVNFPSVDGTYYYDFSVTNTNGYGPLNSRYTYTRSGGEATLTWLDWSGNLWLVYSGVPQSSLTIGFGFLIENTFNHGVSEATQDARYTGTWTISENLNGVEGITGKFDLRRIGITNLTIVPENFNPLETENVEITADVVALPVTTELTPDGWSPSGSINWLVEIDDPLVPGGSVHKLTGSTQPTAPDGNGKVGTLTQTWDGKNAAGEYLFNGQYTIRAQALGGLSSGNVLSKEVPGAIRLGDKSVLIRDFIAEPENFDPEEGETTTLTFVIEASGFENPKLSWEVEAHHDGERVHVFPPGEASGKLHSVTLDWDGIGTSGPISGEVEYKVNAKACDNGVQPQSVDPIRNRALFQSDGGACTLVEMLKSVILGKPLLIVEWEKDSIPPSFLYQAVPVKSNGPESKTTVKVTYLGQEQAVIKLTFQAVKDSGGHVEATHPGERPLGQLLGVNEQYTMESGQARVFQYTAPNVGGDYELTAEITEGPDGGKPAKATLSVEVPGLVPLENFVFDGLASLDLIGATAKHPDNHYGTTAMQGRLVDFYRRFHDQVSNAETPYINKTIWINDMSLEMGGHFNVDANWAGMAAHEGHQKGIEADVGSDEYVTQGAHDFVLEDAAEQAGFHIHDEVDGGSNSHYHLIFNEAANPIPFEFVGPPTP